MKYKDWIKSLPCIVCSDDPPSDPHHLIGDGYGTMGGKSPDELLMPLCRKHHNQIHELSRHAWDEMYEFTQEQMVSRVIRKAVHEGWRMELMI